MNQIIGLKLSNPYTFYESLLTDSSSRRCAGSAGDDLEGGVQDNSFVEIWKDAKKQKPQTPTSVAYQNWTDGWGLLRLRHHS